MRRVEDFVAPHHGNKILRVAEVDDVVGVAGEHYHALDALAGNFVFEDLRFAVRSQLVWARVFWPHLDEAVAFDYDELFPFGVVPVLSLGDSGF